MDITPKDFIDMEDPEVSQNIKDNIEFILDISNEDSHILHVDLKKNYTRAEEAKKIRKKILDDDISKGNVQRIDKDVLIIYIDNISRPHFHRKMKKLDKWISQYAGDLSFETATVIITYIIYRHLLKRISNQALIMLIHNHQRCKHMSSLGFILKHLIPTQT